MTCKISTQLPARRHRPWAAG